MAAKQRFCGRGEPVASLQPGILAPHLPHDLTSRHATVAWRFAVVMECFSDIARELSEEVLKLLSEVALTVIGCRTGEIGYKWVFLAFG
jgi:hypothetical protein